MTVAISIESLTVRFGEVVAVDDVSLSIGEGEFVSIVGPSGCGKTTVLNLLTGLVPLAEGRIEHAARLLGRPYSIDGRVVHGDKMGRQLGFATANIRIKHDKPPLLGVFAVEVHGLNGGPHRGVANLGIRPSAHRLVRPILEVHLFDFSDEI